MSNMPPRMLSAPLRLTAMTLRGIGPYLHGARLEIKPLTILCGENGSGKSTWIDTLNAFKEAVQNDQFPLVQLPDSVRTGINRVLINGGEFGYQRMARLSTSELKSARMALCKTPLSDKTTEREFGKPGVFGFEIEVERHLQIDGVDHDGCELPSTPASIAEKLLWDGEIPCGEKMCLRWSLPSGVRNMVGLNYWVELQISGGAALRLTKSFDGDSSKAGRDKQDLWTFECSSAFFPDLLPNEIHPIQLGTFGPTRHFLRTIPIVMPDKLYVALDSRIAATLVEKACANLLILFRELCRELLSGIFPIGAVRHILVQESTLTAPIKFNPEYPGEDDDDEENKSTYLEAEREVFEDRRAEVDAERQKVACKTRNVSPDGSMTQEVYAHWAYNLMREPFVPRCGAIDNSFHLEDFPFGAGRSVESLSPDFRAHLLSIAPEDTRGKWQQSEAYPVQRNEAGIELLNRVITSRDVFARKFRPDATNLNAELVDMLGATAEVQDERLSSIALLDQDEVVRVNRLMFEALFNQVGRCLHRTGYLFETFVSYWLKRFTHTPVKYGDFEGPTLDDSWSHGGRVSPPSGGLTDATRRGYSRGTNSVQSNEYVTIEDPMDEPYDLYAIIYPPTASGSTPWHAMSTGFHQLAPIVVQAGLLRQNEIMAVENPEVHLHPKLQIKVAEFLMHQANAGKVMLIETHSDLVVRRILRAIREEQVSPGNVFKQSSVGINFTKLEDGQNGIKHARVQPLTIDENGEIGNWPDGFLDDDLKESRRMFDSIYGTESEDDNDGN